MYTTDRRAMIIAILLGALTILLLSACDVTQGSAHAAPGAATTTSATSASGATEAPAATAASAASVTATPIPPQGTSVPTTTAATATPAAPAPSPTEVDDTDPFTGTDDLTDTDDLISTTTLTETQPVAQAIADFFGVSVTEVLTLHQEGLGFGEIARAYFLARELAADGDPANDLSAALVLAMHQGGMGWGQIVASLELPQGNSGRNLGLIMRGHKHDDQGDDGDPAATAPGQPKHNDDSHGGGNGHGHSEDKGHGHSEDKGHGKK
jgi:hypothetical protein